MKNTIYLIIFFVISIHPSLAWQRKIVNYERTQYKAGFQNWMIDQAADGWIYSANSDGLLEFDGINWALYSVKNNMVRSVKVIKDKVYIGGSSEFGFFEHNNFGLLTYTSLSVNIKNWGGEVWNIEEDESKIYFIDDGHIHIYDKQSKNISTIPSNIKIDCSTLFEGIVYIGTPNGIFYLTKAGDLNLLTSSKSLISKKLVSMIPYKDRMLITTAKDGLYFIDKNSIDKLESIADEFISKNHLFSASAYGSKIALGSVQNGVFIFDIENKSGKETFSLNNGLKNNTILNSSFDKDGNLWLAQDKGISYIGLNSPTRPLFATVSPIGTGYCSKMYNDELYLGTNQGLYKLNKDNQYQLIKGSEGQIWSLTIIDNSLFGSGDNGIMVVSNSETYKINLSGAWETHPISENKTKLISATYSGFCILEKINGRWNIANRIAGFFNSTRGFIEDDNAYTYWTVNPGQPIQRITIDSDYNKITSIKTYTTGKSSFEKNISFSKIDNKLVVCTQDGIYEYSRITDRFDHYAELESMLEGRKYYEFLTIDDAKNIWFVSDKELKFLSYSSGEYKKNVYNWGLSNELINNYENVSLLDPTTAIISVDNGFVKLNLSKIGEKNEPVRPYIRKLVCSKNDSIINYGNSNQKIVLSHALNSVRVYFGATDFQRSNDILYSYRLKGLDEEWSMPSSNTSKEYTNLPEGKYTFEVKAIIANNSEVVSTTFVIMPPWYRSVLAQIIYFIITIALLFTLYKKTISKQKRIIHQKGEELIAQNKRHEEENKIKDDEIYELQNENLRTELHYKTQELSGYVLNVIRKNEILEEVKRSAINISKAIDEEKQPNSIRQKVMRLISQINSNIEHDNDFEVFKSNFDLVHQDFFKLLDERFPQLSRNDKILCAYLNMNLSTKEIAPLLNISIRGVEVSRYRLRKKMDLDRDINLTEYLKSIR